MTVQYGIFSCFRHVSLSSSPSTTGTDPNFLDSFFSNSRLSFIGSYKQRTSEITSPSKNLCARKSKNDKRFVFHVDMDCFFAAVVLRSFPQYRDKPVAISHQGKRKTDTVNLSPEIPVPKNSTSECATCNYKAREFGVKKGMYLGRAKQLCPDLVVLHYDFEGYEEVSEQVLEILHRTAAAHGGSVEVVSCDEAYMELSLANDDGHATALAAQLAESVRKEIFETTQCTASIGSGDNKFLAKLGTDRCKPDGSYVVKDYRMLLEGLKLRDLHGIGYRSEPKLAVEGLVTVQDVWDLGANAEAMLNRCLGPGLGTKIFRFCQGQDDRQVKPVERKTIGAEVSYNSLLSYSSTFRSTSKIFLQCNYGVRFDGPYGIEHFMRGMADEVQKRMEGVGVKGRRLTLKVKQRKKGAKPAGKVSGKVTTY
jgi:DNA repair protein REV1